MVLQGHGRGLGEAPVLGMRVLRPPWAGRPQGGPAQHWIQTCSVSSRPQVAEATLPWDLGWPAHSILGTWAPCRHPRLPHANGVGCSGSQAPHSPCLFPPMQQPRVYSTRKQTELR